MSSFKPEEYTKKIVKVKRKMTAQTKSGRIVYRPLKQNTTESEELPPPKKLTFDLSVSEGIQELRLKKDLLWNCAKKSPEKVIAKSKTPNKEIFKSLDTQNQIKMYSSPQEIKECGTLTNSEVRDRLEKLEITQIRTFNLLEKTYALLESHMATESKLQRLRRKPREKLPGFPKKSVEGLEALENEDMDMTRLQLQEHWKAIGATKLRDFIKIALNDSMEPSLIKKITWTGAGNSYKFEDTKMATAMFDAARECSTFEGPENLRIFSFEFGQAMRVLKQGFKIKENFQERSTDNFENADHAKKLQKQGQSIGELQYVKNNGKVPNKILEETDEYVIEYISDYDNDENDNIEYVDHKGYRASDEEI
ncbi:unnamed protein product [Brassicogethes aeneus]|uniref:DUF4806 domain-containing protein n=1 Tax=Brassicogethes aeneus TaxID=1431903 RepID=A0A9P0AZX1_BRAAE|nr:unnamed protein product [Brassicogethes aeneus]